MEHELEMGAWDNRFGVAVLHNGRWTTIAYADHHDEALEVAEKAKRRYQGVKVMQAGELVDTFGIQPSGSLIGPNPRVNVNIDDADRDMLIARVDTLTQQLQKGIKLGTYAFGTAAILMLILILRNKKSV